MAQSSHKMGVRVNTGKLGGRKKKRRLTAVDFVRAVLAVRAPVAPPAAVDAIPIGTLELVAPAADRRLVLVSAAILRPLVGPVGAVPVAVAAPHGRNAQRVVALEGAAAAGGFGAVGLV